MARTPSETLTGREAQIMDAVWSLGEATAEQVRAALPEPLHDSTVRTLLRVLEEKGYLRHEARGKAYVYRAAIGRQKAQRRALTSILARFFGGSAPDLVLRLIEDERITPQQLDLLRRATPAAGRRSSGSSRQSKKGNLKGERS
jgi:predicted transcriptional regulator